MEGEDPGRPGEAITAIDLAVMGFVFGGRDSDRW